MAADVIWLNAVAGVAHDVAQLVVVEPSLDRRVAVVSALPSDARRLAPKEARCPGHTPSAAGWGGAT